MRSLRELYRRYYRELVKGRTSVRVVPATAPRLDTIPVFLTGIFRSGTTLLRYILDSHSHICCPPESNFMRVLSELASDHDNREGLRGLGFDEKHVLVKVREFVGYFFENYAKSVGKPRWADKTPAYVEHLDFIDQLFPNAQYLMICRHGLDVANSIARWEKFTSLERYLTEADDARVAAAAYWAACMARMLTFQEAHAERCHAIRYEELCATPEPILKGLFAFLNEPWEPEVLEYYRFKHDRGFEDARVGATGGFSASQENYRSWPSEIIVRAQQAAEPVLSQLGYQVLTSTSET